MTLKPKWFDAGFVFMLVIAASVVAFVWIAIATGGAPKHSASWPGCPPGTAAVLDGPPNGDMTRHSGSVTVSCEPQDPP